VPDSFCVPLIGDVDKIFKHNQWLADNLQCKAQKPGIYTAQRLKKFVINCVLELKVFSYL
jgi:hypothetical protein